MRLHNLIHLAIRYLGLGIVIFGFLAVIWVIGYVFVYKKVLKGKKRLHWKTILWYFLFISYLSIVIGATLLGRVNLGVNGAYRTIRPLFYSYKEAWINFSKAAWRNIILNYAMLIPLGIMLPMKTKWFQTFWKTYLAGFSFSLCIELIQLIYNKGIFECDDLLGNTVGTMIGYGLFAVILSIKNLIKKKKQKKISVLILQFPLLITVMVFSLIFIHYHALELGINPNNYITEYNNDLIHVTGSNFSDKQKELSVYQIPLFTVDETKERGKMILETLGSSLDESNLDIYDNTLVMRSEDNRYDLWMEYYGGTYSLTDFEILHPSTGETLEPIIGADESVVKEAVNKLGIAIPEESEFKEIDSGVYKFTMDMIETKDGLLNGMIQCRYYGEYGIGQLTNQILNASFYKKFDAISEQEAYKKIVDGKFLYMGHENLTIQVDSCSIVYCIDSKGFYQPNYCFKCNINGKEDEIIIPALK